MNPDVLKLYESNNLTITRQVHYSTKHEKSVDVVLFLNGIPIITIELKNPMTGQTSQNAVHQYRHDRDQNDLLFSFKKRALVHFAVDTDEVYMTTRLLGESTEFLPFNKGNNNGAGNPENPHGYKTSYLWEEVLKRDSLLDIVARFLHLQIVTVQDLAHKTTGHLYSTGAFRPVSYFSQWERKRGNRFGASAENRCRASIERAPRLCSL